MEGKVSYNFDFARLHEVHMSAFFLLLAHDCVAFYLQCLKLASQQKQIVLLESTSKIALVYELHCIDSFLFHIARDIGSVDFHRHSEAVNILYAAGNETRMQRDVHIQRELVQPFLWLDLSNIPLIVTTCN